MAKVIEVEQKVEDGATIYSFVARGTEYSVITRDGESFEVWSRRQSLPRTSGSLKVYHSLAELGQRSKALRQLAELIAA